MGAVVQSPGDRLKQCHSGQSKHFDDQCAKKPIAQFSNVRKLGQPLARVTPCTYAVTTLVHASPFGVFGWGVCYGVDSLLIGSVLHRVNASLLSSVSRGESCTYTRPERSAGKPSGNFAVLIQAPARFRDYHDLY